MPESPLVSVIIPALNAEKWIPIQLERLGRQRQAPSFEVVVADNGSTDATVDVAKESGRNHGISVRVVDATSVRSASFARNTGAAAAYGDILAFADADDLLDFDWLAELTVAVLSSDDTIATGSLIHEGVNPPEVLYAYNIPPDPPKSSISSTQKQNYELGGPFAGYLATVSGGNFAIRRIAYLALGGMDASYPGGSEETDFAWRAQEAGMRVVSAPRARITYRLRHDARSVLRQQRIQQRARVMLWTRFRHSSMIGPSLRYSAVTLVKETVMLALRWRSRSERLRASWLIGAHIGAIEGIMRYRLLGHTPDPQLWNQQHRNGPSDQP